MGLYTNSQLILKTEDLGILHPIGRGYFKVPSFSRCGLSCPCLNDPGFTADRGYLDQFWHFEPWIAACGTLATVGILVALAVGIFILVRICKGSTMEGSQAFAFLLLFGVILTFVSIVPFMLASSPIVCIMRPVGMGLAYAFLFSPILARSLMIATSDPDGILGHVSGLVQTSLFFFMVAVQIGLAFQQLWLVIAPGSTPESGRFDGIRCHVLDLDYYMSLSYDAFLLLLLLILTPFCVRNKRNYNEGLFFLLASLGALAIWIAFIVTYFHLSSEWKQPLLCWGVVSTATVVLMIVYIPRMFKMVRSVTLDTVNSGLRTSRSNVPSLTDVNIRASNAMIYETVNHAFTNQDQPLRVGSDGHIIKANVFDTSHSPESDRVTFRMADDTKSLEESPPNENAEDPAYGAIHRKPPTVTHL